MAVIPSRTDTTHKAAQNLPYNMVHSVTHKCAYALRSRRRAATCGIHSLTLESMPAETSRGACAANKPRVSAWPRHCTRSVSGLITQPDVGDRPCL